MTYNLSQLTTVHRRTLVHIVAGNKIKSSTVRQDTHADGLKELSVVNTVTFAIQIKDFETVGRGATRAGKTHRYICCLFNDAVSRLNYIVSNDSIINE